MKIAFYAPLKPISYPTPSGDREIARSVHAYFCKRGGKVFVLSEFRTRWFYKTPARWMEWISALLRAYRRVKVENPDVFFTYHLYYKAPDPIGFLLAWWFNKPFFVYEGMYSRKAARKKGRWAGFYFTHFALRYATKIFSDKSIDYSFLVEWFDKNKVVFLLPSVDLRRFDLPDTTRAQFREHLGIGMEEIVVASIAMLRPDRKTESIRFLLDTLVELRDEGFLFRWVHAGNGECFEEIQKMAHERLGARAHFLGSVDQLRVTQFLKSADVFAFPGLNEPFGLVYVEAQASGLPVVAFDNTGVPDAVEKDGSALLTPPMDREAYKAALKMLMKEPAIRKKMGERGRMFAQERFDAEKNYALFWDAMAASIQSKK